MMAELDPVSIGAFVNDVYGVKTPSGVKLDGLHPELASRLQQAQYAYKQKYGKDFGRIVEIPG